MTDKEALGKVKAQLEKTLDAYKSDKAEIHQGFKQGLKYAICVVEEVKVEAEYGQEHGES